ncbi:MAG: riboflavin biosynthesis protein RibF [Planctomycetota bacterium]|nr:riboflavin biosynthesis protein RibF [Planctomycetota bacterium]
MRLIEGLDALRELDLASIYGERSQNSHSVVAVGVFDGVHLGHHRLLHQLLEMGSALQGMPTVVTFANHPDQVLRGDAPPPLCSVPHRLRLLRRAGVLRLVLLQFEERLMNMTARAFAEDVLLSGLRARGLLLGYDSAMGKDREGTPQRFSELGDELGFDVQTGAPFELDGEPISSTRIRAAIASGDLATARRCLGRFPGALGEVIHGDARGRTMGFPTANVALQTGALPPAGVYAVEAVVDGDTFAAVANLGARPTFDDGEASLEVHLLDFDGDLYGRELEVTFRQLLREQRCFDGPEDLKRQIAVDVTAARTCLKA